MTVTASIVPNLTRADLIAWQWWNYLNENARRAYDEDPFAATRQGSRTCSRCREKKHHKCATQALIAVGLVPCACWLAEHTA